MPPLLPPLWLHTNVNCSRGAQERHYYRIIAKASDRAVATLEGRSVTLHPGYAWDGSTGAADTPECMRASALHDVWCQAMDDHHVYMNDFGNWCRAAVEYRKLCIEDGMSWPRAWARYSGLIAYAGYKNGKDAVVSGAKKAWNVTTNVARKAGTAVANGAKKVWKATSNVAKKAGTAVANGAKKAWRWVKGWF